MNFQICLGDAVIGGFSDVSGLSMEQGVAAGHTDITLKRGIVAAQPLFAWFKSRARQDVTIVLRDESQRAVVRWKLSAAMPLKYTGPVMSGKGADDVAMEELVLSCEGLVNLGD